MRPKLRALLILSLLIVASFSVLLYVRPDLQNTLADALGTPKTAPDANQPPSPQSGFPLSTEDGGSVPTRAQVRSAAYTLQAQINAAAGRKTSSASDGGAVLYPPYEITTSTEWVHRTISFSRRMYLNISGAEQPPVTKVLNLWVNNSILYANNLTTLFYPTLNINNPCCYNPIPWTINIYITNSTVRDFGNLTWPGVSCTYCGYMSGTAFNLYYDNATVTNVGSTATNLAYNSGTNCDIQFHFCDSFVHDSTFRDYNMAAGYNNNAVVQQNDAGHPSKGYANRNRFIHAFLTAGDAMYGFPVMKYNYIDDMGFNGIVSISRNYDFSEDGAPIAQGERLNISYNYFSMTPIVEFGHHTAIGVYGSTFNTGDLFQPPMFGSNQHASIYKNYVNNSRYIEYQTGGNASNLYFINNYFANGGPTFTEAWGLDSRTHNVTLDSNYIFDDISTGYYTNGVCCHGIVMSGFEYNFTVKNNVLYDIGGYGFEVGSQGLKFKNSTNVERSDYSYRAESNTFIDNHVDGINYFGIFQDSGYTTWYNNTFTHLCTVGANFGGDTCAHDGGYIDIVDGWCPYGLGAQIDWFGGTDFRGQVTKMHFTNNGCNITNWQRQTLVWFRTFQGGTVKIKASNANYPVQYAENDSSAFWGRTFDCIQEQTPSTATYWTQLPCNPMEDHQNFTNPNNVAVWAWRPRDYMNYTRAFTGEAHIPALLKITYTIPAGKTLIITDLTTGNKKFYYIGTINMAIEPDQSHSYLVSEGDFYLVPDGACTKTNIAGDADCWAGTSGGAGGVGIPGPASLAIVDANSGAFDYSTGTVWDAGYLDTTGASNSLIFRFTAATTLHGNLIAPNGKLHLTSPITIYGDWNTNGGEQYAEAGTVTFAGTSQRMTVDPTNGVHVQFYNVVISSSSTTTVYTSGTIVYNVLTVNGILQTPDTLPGSTYSYISVEVEGIDSANPLVLGASGDISGVADFRYLTSAGDGITTHYIAAATYHYLDVPNTDQGTNVRLAGDIRTRCKANAEFSPGVPTFNKCAMLIAGWTPGLSFNFFTDNHAMDIAGLLWLGDVGDRSVHFNAGSSVITAGGIQIKESSTALWGTSTVTSTELFGQGGQPGYSHQGQVYSYAQNARFTIHGDFFFYDPTTESVSYTETALYGNTSVWNVDGWAVVEGTKSFINFGSSTWTIGSNIDAAAAGSLTNEGIWYNQNRDARWDAGTSTVTFRTNRDARFNSAGAALGEREFNNLIIESASGSHTYLMNTFSPNTQGLWVNSLTVRGGGGTTTLNMNSKTLRVDSTLSLGTSGSVSSTGATVTVDTVRYVGGTASSDLPAPTVIYDGTTFSGITPLGVTFSASSGLIRTVTWEAFTTNTGTVQINWSFNPSIAGSTITITVTGLPSGRPYTLSRDSTSIMTDSDLDTTASFIVTGGWSLHEMGITGASGGGGGGSSTPVDGRPYFKVTYPNAGLLDWLSGQDACLTVQITDIGTTGTTSYQYDFGDGESTTTNMSSIRHTYASPGVYTVDIITSGSYGSKRYFLTIDATNACSLHMFSSAVALPLLILAIVLGFVGAFLVFSKRYRKTGAALVIAAVVFGILFVIFAYYAMWQLAVPW